MRKNNLLPFSFYYTLLLMLPFILGMVILPFTVMDNFSNSFHHPKFYIVYIASSLALGLMSYYSIDSYYVPLSKLTKVFLVILLTLLGFNYWLHSINFLNVETFQRIVFWSLVFYGISIFHMVPKGQEKNLFIPLFIGCFIFIILDFFLLLIFAEHPLYLTFGNQNISAEYVGLTLALQMGVYLTSSNKVTKKFLDFLIPLSVSYVFFTNCRSAYLGVFLFTIYLLIQRYLSLKTFLCWTFSAILFSGVYYLALNFFHPEGILEMKIVTQTAAALEKEGSTKARWTVMFYTLNMIKDFPLGIGLGRYEFFSIPYLTNLSIRLLNENMTFKSPHSEILRFLAEDGLLIILLMGACILSFFRDYWNKLLQTFATHPEIATYGIFLGVQFGVQFPLDNPFPFFLTAVMVAYLLTQMQGVLLPITVPKIKPILLGLFAFLTLMTIAKVFAGYIEQNYRNNLSYNRFACAVDPSSWSTCLNVVSLYLDQKNYQKAEEYAKQELSRRSYNFHAIRYLAFAYLDQGQAQKACPLFKQYDVLFKNQSSIHEIIKTHCE